MIIDNFEKIISLMKFEKDTEFYFIQIISRKKDNPWTKASWVVMKEYSIFSIEDLMKKTIEITEICNTYNARAYIRLSRRDTKDIAIDMIWLLAKALQDRSFNHIRKLYSTAVWRSKWLDKLWIIDIDWECSIPSALSLEAFLNTLRPVWWKVIEHIPTPNWLHIITKPFDLKEFNSEGLDIDVHKNNPTILYSNT